MYSESDRVIIHARQDEIIMLAKKGLYVAGSNFNVDVYTHSIFARRQINLHSDQNITISASELINIMSGKVNIQNVDLWPFILKILTTLQAALAGNGPTMAVAPSILPLITELQSKTKQVRRR